ncbi:MAG: SDR family NAD(P)-dependent oxidoreductase [Actinomycetota bacterium]
MSGKVILIAGASSGIGHASARALIARGHTVYAGARRVDRLADLAKAGAHHLELDVTDDGSVHQAVDRVMSDQGRIDGLFANAGYCLLGPAELHATEEVVRQFDTNVIGMGRSVAAVLPHMRRQRSGTVAITSSGAGHVSMPGMVWYPATKHAQQGYAKGLRLEVKEFGINVVLIEPGYIDTDIDNASLPYLDLAAQHPEASAYKTQIANFRKNWSEGVDNGASPDTIARVVVKAFESRRPKRAYHPNADARMAILVNRIFGDRLLDRILPGQSIA